MLFAVNVDVAVRRGPQWLLIVRGAGEGHAAGLWSLVGGTVEVEEPGSDVLEATARREVAEEVGVALTGPLAFVESAFFVADDGEPVLNVVFAADVPADVEPVITAPDEVASLAWRTLAEVEADPAVPEWTRRALQRAAGVRPHVPSPQERV